MRRLTINTSEDLKRPDEVLDRVINFRQQIEENTLTEVVSVQAFRIPSGVEATDELIVDDEDNEPAIVGETGASYRMRAGQTHPDWRIDVLVAAEDGQRWSHSVALKVEPAYQAGGETEDNEGS